MRLAIIILLSATLTTIDVGVADAASSRHQPALETENYRFIVRDGSGVSLQLLADNRERMYDRICDFLEVPLEDGRKIDYHVYSTFESKGLSTGDTRLAHVNPDELAIHVVLNDWIRGDDGHLDAALIVRQHLGRPATACLETGLAVYFSERWHERGYDYWAAVLHGSGNLPPLAEILDNSEFSRESYLVAEACAASFVAMLLDTYGKALFLGSYGAWQPDPREIARLEREWHEYLDSLVARHKNVIANRPARKLGGFQKGFCHAHEGYQIFNGYLSRKSDDALEKLASLGTNAVSITPFSYMRDPTEPVRFRFSHQPGAENDECLIHSANTARELGLSVMLKPHIWLRGGWPGDVEMRTEADWELFFAYYYRWMRHYALLGEMYGFEILCVGVELGKATVGHEAEWIAIFNKLRGIFRGQLTYAANWGSEFENVTFWKSLDYIGINCYYPLSPNGTASADELRRGAERMMEKIAAVQERYQRPVLITEIGFTSTEAPWRKPHEPGWRKRALPQHQAMCYEAIFQAVYGKEWCDGIYWWKWPSFLEYGGAGNPGFTPAGKPAEATVRRWFSRDW